MNPAAWPVVLSLPHGGLEAPEEITAAWAVDVGQIRSEADLGSLEVFGDLPALAVVRARHSRLVVDLNRRADDASEGGVIPLLTYPDRREIHLPGQRPDARQRQERLNAHYWPYHQKLQAALRFSGVQGLLDCHSMDPLNPDGSPRPQICLGDCRGLTCGSGLLLRLEAAFLEQGFQVARHDPYAGGHITRHYGQELMARGLFAVQIELNKALFLRPHSLELDPERLAEVRRRVAAALAWFSQGI